MPEQFYKMTFGQFQLNAEGYKIRQTREWERMRLLMATIHNSVGHAVQAVDLFPLDTDIAKEAARQMTDDEVRGWITKFEGVKWISSYT